MKKHLKTIQTTNCYSCSFIISLLFALYGVPSNLAFERVQ
jgi:hypothetical protein